MGNNRITVEMVNFIRGILTANENVQVALEFIAAGWQPIGRLGFLHNAIAFDALFGVQREVRKSILRGIEKNAGRIDKVNERAGILLNLRNKLLHGEYPRLEDCPEFLEYVEKFGEDPKIDQIKILQKCLWTISGSREQT